MFIFDGANMTITIDAAFVVNDAVSFTPEELWTAYVDWSVLSDNLKFTSAMSNIGGNTIGGGQAVGIYVFLRNDLGWIGMPPVHPNVSISINGSLFGQDPTLPIMGQVGGQTTNLIVNRSSLVTKVTENSGSGLSIEEHSALLAIPNNPLLTNDVRVNNLDTTISSRSSHSVKDILNSVP